MSRERTARVLHVSLNHVFFSLITSLMTRNEALMSHQIAGFRDATTTYLSHITHHAIMHQNHFAEVYCRDAVLL